ncbi:serine hydrolase domain-containing protein [Psychrobium sp. nBUS_13]|uniref:serine hydrolase domain-containing protein n=1 Tax=Psychrobium sp. nBUS_13 TaxID=3395319 RepID=UPI003EB9330A
MKNSPLGVFNGECAPAFSPLLQTYRQQIELGRDKASSLAVYLRGELVFNYAASIDPEKTWKTSDRICTMSACKGPLALCILQLVEREKLALDMPVAHYWPAFGHNGKEAVTVRQVLNHTAGIPVVKAAKSGDIFNWHAMINAIEKSPLTFTPGENMAYHALTYGHILGELIKRIDGRSPGDYFHQEFSTAFDIEYDLHARDNQPLHDVISTRQFSPMLLTIYSKILPLISHWKLQYFNPCSSQYNPNSHAWRTSEIPAVTGQGSARGLAKFYSLMASTGNTVDHTPVSQLTLDNIFSSNVTMQEKASNKQWHMALGFMRNSPDFAAMGPNPNTVGHFGMGGSVGFIDPDNQLSFAYVTADFHQPTRRDTSMAGERLNQLIETCYECL